MRRSVFSRLIVLLLICAQGLVPAAAQTATALPSQLPALGDGLDMSLGAERALGDRIARQLYRSPAYLDDPILDDYVQAIWRRLMAAARLRGELTPELEERYAWRLMLGRDRSINAFALPGGYLGIHLGLIAAVDSDDELASVLAHELTHVTQRHIARHAVNQGQITPWMIGAIILGALVAGASPDAGAALIVGGQAAAIQGQLSFSRDMEREADRIGYGVMTQAGFDGSGFPALFEKLQQASRLNDSGAFPYLRSHPLTTERIADMQARGPLHGTQSAATQPRSLVQAMLSGRAQVLASSDTDNLRVALQRPVAADFAQQRASVRAQRLYAAALAACHLREFEQAESLWMRLAKVAAVDPDADYQTRLLGAELALAAGDAAGALTRLPEAAPDGGTTRALLMLRVQAQTRLSGSKQPAAARTAAQSLQVWLTKNAQDALAWQQLSAAYAAQGQTLRAVRAEAESYVARLDYPAARDRLRAAQALHQQTVRQGGDIDHIEASIIDARSRQIEVLVRELQLTER